MQDRRQRFEAEVLVHLDAAYRFARWLAPAPGDADDLVQEAALRAYRAFDDLRGPNAKAWLLTIVKNCHTSGQRARRDRYSVPLPQELEAMHEPALTAKDDPVEATLAADRARLLSQALAALPEDQRTILVLREIEDLDYRAIAQVIGIPLGTVMSRLARARAALREHWSRLEAMPCP